MSALVCPLSSRFCFELKTSQKRERQRERESESEEGSGFVGVLSEYRKYFCIVAMYGAGETFTDFY